MNQTNHQGSEEIFFAAANSKDGFVSFYDRVFDRPDIRHRYIIQGGPGTGKSSLMRRVAEDARSKGRSVVYYRCSSDPDSLDAILIDGQIVLLDGTAPHAVEPKLPGARDEILNLGQFWDGERLAGRYAEIAALCEEKGDCYRRATRYLSASAETELACTELCLPFLKKEKMEAAVARLLRELPDGEGYALTPGLRHAIGMKGRASFDTYQRTAKKIYAIEDYYGMGYLFLALVIDGAKRKQCPIRVSFMPLLPDRPDGVLFENSGVCFLLEPYQSELHQGRIHMRRFVDSGMSAEQKAEYRRGRRMGEALLESAEEALADAGQAHFKLEEIYSSCMDFSALFDYVTEFCRKHI